MNALIYILAILAVFSMGALLEYVGRNLGGVEGGFFPDPTPNPAPYDDQAEYRAAGGAR